MVLERRPKSMSEVVGKKERRMGRVTPLSSSSPRRGGEGCASPKIVDAKVSPCVGKEGSNDRCRSPRSAGEGESSEGQEGRVRSRLTAGSRVSSPSSPRQHSERRVYKESSTQTSLPPPSSTNPPLPTTVAASSQPPQPSKLSLSTNDRTTDPTAGAQRTRSPSPSSASDRSSLKALKRKLGVLYAKVAVLEGRGAGRNHVHRDNLGERNASCAVKEGGRMGSGSESGRRGGARGDGGGRRSGDYDGGGNGFEKRWGGAARMEDKGERIRRRKVEERVRFVSRRRW